MNKNELKRKVIFSIILTCCSILTLGVIEIIDRVVFYQHFYFYNLESQIQVILILLGITSTFVIMFSLLQGTVILVVEKIRQIFFHLNSRSKVTLSLAVFNRFYYSFVVLLSGILGFLLINNNFRSQSSNQTLLPTLVKMIENSNSYVSLKEKLLANVFINNLKSFIENGDESIKVGPILIATVVTVFVILFSLLLLWLNKKFSLSKRIKVIYVNHLSENIIFKSIFFAIAVITIVLLYYIDAYVYSNLYQIFHVFIEIIGIITLQLFFFFLLRKKIINIPDPVKNFTHAGKFFIVALLCISLASPLLFSYSNNKRNINAWTYRHTSFQKHCLSITKWLFDFDRDGYSWIYDGGDQNDFNPAINPLSNDIPNNNIDENGIGGDLDTSKSALRKRVKNKKILIQNETLKDSTILGKNVILIHVDGLRADRVGVINPTYHRELTPGLDKFAEKSITFRNTIAQGSRTHASLHPMRAMSYSRNMKRNDMMELDSLFSSVGILHKDFYQYFSAYIDDEATTDSLITYFEKNKPSDFFYWIYYGGPHYPNISHGYGFGNKEEDLYDEDVKFTDLQLSRFLNYLEKTDYFKNTLIIIYGDHGEELYDHGSRFHGVSLYNELIHVPLIIYSPNRSPKVIDKGVELIDIFPTIIDFLNLKVDEADFRDGISLTPFINTGDSKKYHKYLISEREPGVLGIYREVSIIDSELRMKLIYNYESYTFELYDLWNDPFEKNNIIDVEKEKANKLEVSLDFFLNGYIIDK